MTRSPEEHLFDVIPEEKNIVQERKWILYHSVAQCLFMYFRAQRYAKTTTVLLSKYIQEPHEVDRGKLKRILKYFI